MKKFILSFGLFFLLLAGFVTDASAKDMSRRFGVGVDSTISSYADDGRGLSLIYVINKYFGMQIIFGLDMTTAEITDDRNKDNIGKYDTTIINWNVALRGLIPIVLSSDVNLTAVVGFSASGRASDGFYSSDERFSKYNDGFQFAIDLGVRPEWFVSEHFSLHTQVGIGINIITSNGSELHTGLSKENQNAYNSTNASGVEIDFFKNVDFLGMAGFTFWF